MTAASGQPRHAACVIPPCGGSREADPRAGILPAAAEVLPLNAAQKQNLGIVTVVAATGAESPALTYPAQVTLPPASVHVVAATGEALVTRLHVQAGDAVRRGAPLVSLSMPGLVEAQNALTQARLRAQLTAGNAARDEKLFAEGLVAEARLRATQRVLMIVAQDDELIPQPATEALWQALQRSQAQLERLDEAGAHLQGSRDPRIGGLVETALTWMGRVGLR